MFPRIVYLSLLLVSAPALAAPSLPVEMRGAFGERVVLGQARTTILVFMSRRAPDESASFGREIDERTLAADVDSIAVVDLRRYGGWLRRLVDARLRRSAEEALARRRERRLAQHADASDAAVGRWHLVGDFDGALSARFAVAADPEHPLAFVLDRHGATRGPFRGVSELVAAVGQAMRD